MAYLGNQTQITIGVSDLDSSLSFYQKLGFRLIDRNTQPNPWAQVSDDGILILLNQDDMSYLGLTYFSPGMPEIVAELKAKGVTFEQEIEQEGKAQQAIFATPSGFRFSLINHDGSSMFQPEGTTLADVPPTDWGNPPVPNPQLGIFGELATPVKDLEEEMDFYKNLGFQVNKMEGPYPWAIAVDGKSVIGLHQTSDFTEPAITYFAKEMGSKIGQLKAAGVEGFEVFGGTGGNNENNQVLHSPEGQQLFLFSF
jgi:catechol 2,3-dioxygenase-like lactoylglutathione lyase family enzyme